MKLQKRGLTRRFVSVALSATMLATSISFPTAAEENKGTINVVKIDPTKASAFNDTNGDGLGEFEGFGTSLCWWANRIGYNEELTNKAGELFFNAEKGLGMSIGRYNLGGGDLVGEVKIPEAKANDKAVMYDVENNHAPSYHGNKMSVSTVNFGETKYEFSDADFGFLKGNAVGSFKYVGWINRLEDEAGDGDKLEYTIETSEEGEYTVKFLITLTGTNERDIALRVFDKEDEEKYTDYVVSADDINSNRIANNGNNKLFIATLKNVKLAEGKNKVWVAGQNDWTLDFIKMAVIKSGEEGNVEDMEDASGVNEELPEFFHADHIIRSDAGVPGYCKDVTRIDTSEKSIEDYENEYDRVDTTSGFAWNYDWNADKNQINVLKAAIKNGGDEFITEVFSNSPPYFMTVSGCSSGNTDAGKDNLRSDCYDAFAKYMADVIKHWVDNGIDVQSTTPMNEPYTNFWAAKSNKQEGCHFDIGDSQSKIYTALRRELDNNGLQNVLLSASDETSIDTAITAYNALSSDAKNVVDRIDTHSYSGSKRSELNKLATSEGKNLWMSEVDGSVTAGENAGQMSAALGIGQQMITDVNGLKSSAWILWNAIDMHVDSSDYGKSWVDKGSSNDFLSKDDLYSRWIPNDNSGYWGFAAANHDTNEIYLTKKYYGFGQFSRYIRPGYTIIGSSSEGNVMAAYDPSDEKAVVVVLNTKEADATWKFDLSLFNEVDDSLSVKAIRTSGSLESGENWADVSENDNIVINADDKAFTATLKGNSITTYIIDGVKYDPENPVSDNMTELTISRSAISGSAPWSGGTGCDVDKLIDNNFDTFFDGVTNGYVIVDLGAATKLEAIAFAPRSGYTDRAVGAMLAGSNDGESWTKLYTITERPSAGSLTYIYSSQFEGGKNNFRYIKYYVEGSSSNCNVAELKFFTKEPTVSSIENISVVANPGKVPSLPARVEGKTTTGEAHSFFVEWDIDESKFEATKLLDTVTVEGKVTGSSMTVEAKVLVVPSGLEYFVDCNNAESEEFKIAKKGLKGLLNNTPDQKKTSNDFWGSLGDYGKYNGETSSSSGWYAYKNQNIEYVFNLPAGSHEITLCGSGKWWNTSRNMQITYVVDGTEKEITTLKTEKGKEIVKSGKIDLDKASEVTVKVKKASGENQDPVLSWIAIEGPIYYTKGLVYSDGTVEVSNKNDSGKTIDWDIEDLKVNKDLFKFMSVTGTAGEASAKADLLVVPENLEYFVSCNDSDCEEWKLVSKLDSLKNKDSADQLKTSKNSWGRLADYGTYNDESSPASGGYYSSTPIEYVVQLSAGVHDINVCANGYWWSQWTASRSMDVEYEVNGETKSLFTLTTQKDKEIISSGKIILSKDAEVTIRIKKAKNEKEDSIISWFAISNNSTLSFTGTKGEQMYDIDGNRIQAHGGQIQKLGDTWYWIGEDKTQGYQPCPGVHMYSSKDLYNWKDEGVVLKTMTSYDQFDTDDYFKSLYGDLSDDEKKLIYTDLAQGDATNGYKTVIERPKMLYNEKTNKYVIWFHADGKSPYDSTGNSNYAKAKAGIAIADSPTGPYTLLGSYLLASGTEDHGFDNEVGGHVRDMNLFQDEDGTAYVLYSSEGNAVMYIAKLNDSYTGLVKDADKMELGKDFAITSTDSREAPAMFKYENKYYLITSGCTGWNPNQARYAVADSPLGPWTNMGDPCVGDSTNLTFSTQSTCVIPVDAKNGKYIYMGDRWFSSKLEDSRYVWLPIEFGSDSTIMIRDYSDWTLEDLENKASIKITDSLPATAASVSELIKTLPEELNITSSGKSFTDKVSWSVGDTAKKLDDSFIGELTVYGTLETSKREVTCKVLVSPENLVYLTDCYTNTEDNTSEMFNSIAKNSKYLINTVSDQAFAKDPSRANKWGYISTPGASGASAKEDMGSKGSGDFYNTGWWATNTGTIAYAYELKAGKYTVATGFNEWWSATREMNIEVLSVDKAGTEKSLGKLTFTLKNDKELEKAITDIEVPADSDHVVVRVSKKSGGDPILSWIGIVAKETPAVPVNDTPVNNTPANNTPSNNNTSSNDNSSSSSATSNTNIDSAQAAANTSNQIVAADTDTTVTQNTVSNTTPATNTTKQEVKKTDAKTQPAVSEVTGQTVEEAKTEEAKKEETTVENKEETKQETVEEAKTEIKEEKIEEKETPLVSEPEATKVSKAPFVILLCAMAAVLCGLAVALLNKAKKKNLDENE